MAITVETTPALRSRVGYVTQPPSLNKRAWAMSAVYVVIFGVGFAFLVGPANTALAQGASAGQALSGNYALTLVTALTITVGAALLCFSLGWTLERKVRDVQLSESAATAIFGAWASMFAVLVAGLFAAIASLTYGQLTTGILWAAVLGLLVPGMVAGVTTRMVVNHVVATTRELLTTSVAALVVIVLANYMLAGAAQPFEAAPSILGL